jgi:hypothetical protein
LSQERRHSPRFRAKAPLRLSVEGEALPGLLRDICRDAALVESPRPFGLETRLTLTIELAQAAGPLELAGRVIRVADAEGAIHPLAILFTELTPAAATRIDLFLSQQAPQG